MKHNIDYLLLIIVLSLLSTCVSAANRFMVGTSTVSIEPDNSIFSLTLAGYGFPGEGRFTLEWIEKGDASGIIDMAGSGDILYGINKSGELFYLETQADKPQWRIMRSSQPVKYLAVSQNVLFAIGFDDQLFQANLEQDNIQWKSLASNLQGIVALLALNHHLYAATESDGLFEGIVSKDGIIWDNIGSVQSVIGMAGYKDRLFALTSNQMLWRRNTGVKDILWTKIGYNNGYTYNINIKDIAVANDRLYSIGMDNRLYVGQHKSDGNLSASAMAIKKGNQTAVIVGVDLTNFDYSLITDIKHEIYQKKGIPAEAILINASHTHFAPVSKGWYSWAEPNQYPDSLYLNQIVKPRIIEAISKAVDQLRPADLYFGSTTTSIGGNRCLLGEEALYDSTVDVIKVESPNHKLKDILFLTGCHPVFRNAGTECFTISANFPAVSRNIIQDMTGVENTLFLQGCAGDINPIHEDFHKTGSILASDVLKVLERPTDLLTGEITYAIDSILIPIEPWSIERIETFKKENSMYSGNLEADKNVRWANIMLEQYKKGTMPHHLPIYVQTLNIGNWKLIGLSHEAVTQYGMEIRKLWPDKHVSIAGYCNDVNSYLPAASHIKAQTYEGYNSFFWYSQPGFFPENILDTVVSTIKYNNR